MPLSPETRLGTYVILSRLGSGGMGEVYRATDTRLRREVAIKVLPEGVSGDREHLGRLEQEARSASALNHPNIVTIYELGQCDSIHYIAMELVAGETLRKHLRGGPIPWKKVVSIATQAAIGLAKAHEAGIIHRDLKPDNLMISEDGLVKILDFGLAKLVSDMGSRLGDATTLQSPHTAPGTLVGTIQYMSPEQVNGEALDFRCDQFSFGCLLYEMLTGQSAFHRGTVGQTLVAILKEEPKPINSLNADVPAPLCWVVQRCLTKDPQKRYSSTRELARDLETMEDRVATAAPSKPASPPASNLPVQRTTFVGRERELTSVKDLLLRPSVRLVTLTGPGGIGKTRLGLQAAGEMEEYFPEGIYFVSLASVNDASLVPSLIGQALGVRKTKGQSPEQALKEFLADLGASPLLVVLDNFEQLVAAAEVVSGLLTMAPNLKVLVTSRAALHVYGEHEFPVPPFAIPDTKGSQPAAIVSQYPSVSLFLQRATAVKPDFEGAEETLRTVAEICARLDGLPLAIELAAARVKLLSPSAILTRLESRLQLLTGGARDLPARHQTLRAAMDWSYQLLNTEEQRLFRRLSVFAGGCTLEAVEAVCNARDDLGLDAFDGVASLLDKSLLLRIEQADDEPRFVMLGTIRDYGREQLAASKEEDSTRKAHAAYCLVLAEEAGADEGADRSEWLKRMDAEQDNFRAALEYLAHSNNAEWGLRLGASMFRYWEVREQLAEGRDWLVKLLKMPGAAAPNKARARALFAAGVLASEQCDYQFADARIKESLEIANETGDKWAVAVSLNALAVNARDRGDVAASRSLFEESLSLWRDLGDRAAIARALSNLASVTKLQGDYESAGSLYGESLAIFRQLGDRTGAAWSLNHQGDAARAQRNMEGARSLYQQSLSIFRELGDQWGIASSLADLGNLACEQQDYQAAHSLFSESLDMFQGLEHKRGIARLLECFACSAAAQGKAERALKLAGAAAALRQALGVPLPPLEQATLEKTLESARQLLPHRDGTAAWIEGWAMALEQAIEEARKA